MTETGNCQLAKIEQKLRCEARNFTECAQQPRDQSTMLRQTVNSLLRTPGQELSPAGALEQLEKMLAAQRRWSRIRHQAYDLNRHILLERTCKALRELKRSKYATSREFKRKQPPCPTGKMAVLN